MKSAIALAAFTGLISSVSGQYFGVIAARSASPIHLQSVTASGQSLWIGKKTAKYCPDVVKEQGACPKGKGTNFASGDGSLGMGTSVPGGQQVYIDVDGAVKYTQAHSASIPDGALRGGWSTEPQAGESYGHLYWKRGLLACPVDDDGPYQVYAKRKGVKFSDECLGFDALTGAEKKPDAWQYT